MFRDGGDITRIITCGKGDVQAGPEEILERVAFIREEERVIAERRHGEADLLEVEQVLERRNLAE